MKVLRCPQWKVWRASYSCPGAASDQALVAVWIAGAGRDVLRVLDYETGIMLLEQPLPGVAMTAIEREAATKASGEELDENAAHGVVGIALTNTQHCAVAWRNCHVTVWNVPQGTEIMKLQAEQADVLEMAVSRNGSVLALASKTQVSLWQVPSGKALATVTEHNSVGSLALSEDGKHVALGLGDSTVAVHDAHSGQLQWKVKVEGADSILSVVLAVNGKTALVSSTNGRVLLCDSAGKVRGNSGEV